jgi:hypothetical protein
MTTNKTSSQHWIGAACTAIAAAALMPAVSEAHHSFAMYDQTKNETLTGRLTRFVPGANHAQLIFELVGSDGEVLKGDNGKPTVWGVETGPAAQIAEQGITVESFPIGTIMTVTLNPLRNGKTFGALARGGVIIKCGMDMPKGGCNDKTGEAFLDTRGQAQN